MSVPAFGTYDWFDTFPETAEPCEFCGREEGERRDADGVVVCNDMQCRRQAGAALRELEEDWP